MAKLYAGSASNSIVFCAPTASAPLACKTLGCFNASRIANISFEWRREPFLPVFLPFRVYRQSVYHVSLRPISRYRKTKMPGQSQDSRHQRFRFICTFLSKTRLLITCVFKMYDMGNPVWRQTQNRHLSWRSFP